MSVLVGSPEAGTWTLEGKAADIALALPRFERIVNQMEFGSLEFHLVGKKIVIKAIRSEHIRIE